jgi:D-arabinose 1-dehydrogenase-like Zn-dependent alcohol dehydrogenase
MVLERPGPVETAPLVLRFTGLQADGGYAECLTAPAAYVYPLPGGAP